LAWRPGQILVKVLRSLKRFMVPAGKGVANPLALLLAACLMLEHIGYNERADQVRAVTESVLREDRVRTPDLSGKASTQEFTQAITRRLRN